MQNLSFNAIIESSITGDSVEMDSYNLDDDIPIDTKATLDQLTSRFRGIRDGLPELVKNSKDQYSRLGITDIDNRQIVILSNTEKRTLAVLDFAGAPSENFKGWTIWSNPDAGKSEKAEDIEAGHGNGGKAFMVRGASHTAFLESCYKGKRTKKGFINDNPKQRYKSGFANSDGVLLDDADESDTKHCLEKALAPLGAKIEMLPIAAQQAFEKRQAYTIAFLEQVQDWKDRRKTNLKNMAGENLVEIVGSHGQTAMTIETCHVWVMQNGTVVGEKPITPVEILPYPGFETPREFEIPDILPDPETGESIKISGSDSANGRLLLCTSQSQLQISPNTRAKNVIRVWNQRNNVATWTPQELHGVSAASFIYGKLECPSLVGDHTDGATRQHLADTPLVRALKEWAASLLKELADDLHKAMAENTAPKDRERARSALSNIRELMRKFLDPDSAGSAFQNNSNGSNSGDSGDGQKEKRNSTGYGTKIDEIILEPDLRDVTLIAGTKIPLLYRCVEHQEDGSLKPVRATGLVLKSDPEEMFSLNEDGMLTSHDSGLGTIWLETSDGGVKSNQREFWTIKSTGVSVDIPREPLLQGQRSKLGITFQTPDGPLEDALIDGLVCDASYGNIGRHGRLTVGHKEGVIELRIRFGPDSSDFNDFAIQVGSERVPPREGSGDNGGDVPEILLCGEEAPGMEEYPAERRTQPGGPEYPTIIEDPLFPNIVWINANSKEAMRVRRGAGGSSGLGKVGNKTFMHFVALKCFDILKRLHVRQQIIGRSVTEFEYMQCAAEAEMDCADFIDAAWEMTDQLLSREGHTSE